MCMGSLNRSPGLSIKIARLTCWKSGEVVGSFEGVIRAMMGCGGAVCERGVVHSVVTIRIWAISD